MVQVVSTFEEHAGQLRERINAALAGYIDLGEGCPPGLKEAVRYSLLAGGKRLRPLLVLMSAEACGCELERALPAACAVEMIHTYSLVHDDLPAMDDDDLRRGRPTSHKAFGEAMAILAGDALLTLAFEVLARDLEPPEAAAECCTLLARAAGACGMVGGQVDDIEQLPHVEDLSTLESIHRRKTGALLCASLEMGAATAGADPEQRAALVEYGTRLGLAFQIIDDLLDVAGDEEAMGKRVRKDDQRGKVTFPGLIGEEESRRRAEELIGGACRALQPLGDGGRRLKQLARFVLERDR